MTDKADEYHSPYLYVNNNPIAFIDPDGNVTASFLDRNAHHVVRDYVNFTKYEIYKANSLGESIGRVFNFIRSQLSPAPKQPIAIERGMILRDIKNLANDPKVSTPKLIEARNVYSNVVNMIELKIKTILNDSEFLKTKEMFEESSRLRARNGVDPSVKRPIDQKYQLYMDKIDNLQQDKFLVQQEVNQMNNEITKRESKPMEAGN